MAGTTRAPDDDELDETDEHPVANDVDDVAADESDEDVVDADADADAGGDVDGDDAAHGPDDDGELVADASATTDEPPD